MGCLVPLNSNILSLCLWNILLEFDLVYSNILEVLYRFNTEHIVFFSTAHDYLEKTDTCTGQRYFNEFGSSYLQFFSCLFAVN